ncbi:hypothetical protein C4J88_2579 [Pseudomonas sp. R4-39-08]|nr:hypothetical protein C4J88_2579 [Pseudomonas sp. R4-39-08]
MSPKRFCEPKKINIQSNMIATLWFEYVFIYKGPRP